MSKRKYLNIVLEDDSVAYFEAAFKESGFKSATEYVRHLIRNDYLENVKQ